MEFDLQREEDKEEEDNVMEEVLNEPLVSKGVASTLALLNMRGMNLTPAESSSKNPNQKEVVLEYFDDYGNKLTSKEAYKQLSRRFHGKGPGKAKVDKMLKRMEEDKRLQAASSSDTSLGLMATFREQQKAAEVPYVVLSKGANKEETRLPVEVKQDSDKSGEPVAKKPRKIFGMK